MSIKRFSITAQKHVETDYDHLIILKDNTSHKTTLSYATVNNLSEEVPNAMITKTNTNNSLTNTPSNSGSRLVERKDSLVRHIAERKYQRRWQQEGGGVVPEVPESEHSSDDEDADTEDAQTDNKNLKRVKLRKADTDRSESSRKGKARELPSIINAKKEDIKKRGVAEYRKAKAKGRKYRKEEVFDDAGEIDILYENQRGGFFCGIPLYSSRSLLPTDSAPWTNRNHHASPVTIVNAQVPDPTWEWSWKSWFVDMTGDVDEEGWQYSFAFRGSKWHGVSVWWHGWVRRRRWIRKRVKRRVIPEDDGAGSHSLTPEYFTIHSRRGSITPEVGGKRAGSINSSARTSLDSSRWEDKAELAFSDEEVDEEITDVPTLMKSLKRARLDREKALAMESFVHNGGEEVAYLAENIPQIMSSMIFQTSRRKLLAHLLHVLMAVQERRREREKQDVQDHKLSPEEIEREDRYIDGLGRAVDAAEAEVRKLEYWSDIKRVQHSGYAGIENRTDENDEEEAEWIANHGCIGHVGEEKPVEGDGQRNTSPRHGSDKEKLEGVGVGDEITDEKREEEDDEDADRDVNEEKSIPSKDKGKSKAV